jgi:hypothetical protein
MLRHPCPRLAETSAPFFAAFAAFAVLLLAGCDSRAVDDLLGAFVMVFLIFLAVEAVAFLIGFGALIANIVCLVRGRPNRNVGIVGLVVGAGTLLEATGGVSLSMTGMRAALHAVVILLGGGLCYAGYQNVTRARRDGA